MKIFLLLKNTYAFSLKTSLGMMLLFSYLIILTILIMNYHQMDTFGEQLNQPYNYNQHDQPPKTSDLIGRARAAFVRKVYVVLSLQILVTIFFTGLSIFSPAFFAFQVNNVWLFFVAIVAALIVQISIFCCGQGRSFPSNLVLLGIFTLCEAYVVSFVASITGHESGNDIVLLAGIYTLAIVTACTVYAATTEQDFTTSWGIILVLGTACFVLFIMTLFTDSPFIKNLYCCIGVILFGFYLIIDTQLILGGKTLELTVDEWALGAMLLYIDIVQIFLYILQLLGNKD